MTVLIIDTTRPRAWVALVEDEKIIQESFWPADKTLGVKLLEAVDEILAGRPGLGDVDRIAVHGGPGHFSALRTGLVTALLLSRTLDIGLVQIRGEEPLDMIQQAFSLSSTGTIKPEYGP